MNLADTVIEGRRREFAGFREFIDPAARVRIPDPNDPATFDRCKLNWDCLDEPQHKASLEYFRRLLALRRTHIATRLPGMGSSEFELVGESGWVVLWRLSDGGRLMLLANLGDAPVAGSLHYAGTAFYLGQADLLEILAAGCMPPWYTAWWKTASKFCQFYNKRAFKFSIGYLLSC